MRFIKIILVAVLFILALVLVIQNQEVFTHKFELKLNLLVYQIGPYITSNLLLVVTAFLIGVIFAVVWGAFYAVSMKGQVREREKRIRELQLQQQKREALAPSFNPSPVEAEKTEKTEFKFTK